MVYATVEVELYPIKMDGDHVCGIVDYNARNAVDIETVTSSC